MTFFRPDLMRIHQGDVDWFIDQHTTAAMEFLSLLILMSKTSSNGIIKPTFEDFGVDDVTCQMSAAEIWKNKPYGSMTPGKQIRIHHSVLTHKPAAEFMTQLGAEVGAMAWRYDTNGQEIKEWTGSTSSDTITSTVVPSAEDYLRTINAFLVSHTSEKNAFEAPTKREYLYSILLENFTSIDRVNMVVFDAFVALHTPLFAQIQELMHIAISSFQDYVEPEAVNEQWARTMAIISEQLKRKDVTPRYTAKTLLEFFGSVWRPRRIWHFNDIFPAPPNVVLRSARAALYDVTTLQCKILEQKRAQKGRRTLLNEMAIQNLTASASSQQEPPQPKPPQPVLSIIALVLAVVALVLVGLIGLMRIYEVFKQLKRETPYVLKPQG